MSHLPGPRPSYPQRRLPVHAICCRIALQRTRPNQTQTLAEDIVLASNTPTFSTCSLRLSPILGPNDPTVIPSLHSCIPQFQTPFILGSSATALQDYIYVSNAADAHVLAVQNLLGSQTAAGEAFFITNGQPLPLRHICLAVWNEFGHVPPFEVQIPENMAWALGAVAEVGAWVTGSETALSRGVVDDACRQRYVSITKARAVLGYKPRVSLEEGIRRGCEWYKGVLGSRVVRKERGGWS
jgi:sterol-4alpha-carboxylate 3-dehydrogenase (decarboxylating)